jgi:hypothetical protein
MYEKIIIAVVSGIILALLTWFVGGGRARWERRKVYQWLKTNTYNKPGETHVDTIKIAKGTGLTEDRARNACIVNSKIFRYSNGKEQWSVWREEPQSVYEGLSSIEISKRMSF